MGCRTTSATKKAPMPMSQVSASVQAVGASLTMACAMTAMTTGDMP